MAKISVRETLRSSVAIYLDNFLVLTGAGALLGALGWATGNLPRLIAFHLNLAVEQPVVGADQIPVMMARLFDGLNVQWRSTMVSTSPKGAFVIGALGIIFGLLYYWVYLGYAKMILEDEKSGNVTSLQVMFTGDHKLLRVIGATILYILGMIVFAVGVGLVCFAVAKIHPVLSGIGAFIGWIGLMHGLTRALFFPFFILDKNLKAIDALRASWEATRGNTLKIFGFFLLFMFLAMICMVSISALARLVFSILIASFIFTVFTTGCLGGVANIALVKMYRTVTK